MSETYIYRAGIVEGVKAQRKNETVEYLAATIRFETELKGTYYGEENRVDDITVAVAANEGVNPGDAVVMSLQFKSPFDGKRFQPALEVSEDPTDVIDEDILINEDV